MNPIEIVATIMNTPNALKVINTGKKHTAIPHAKPPHPNPRRGAKKKYLNKLGKAKASAPQNM